MIALKIGRIVVIGFLFFMFSKVHAQTNFLGTKDTVSNRFLTQALLYPQEKIHLQIDKPHYVSNERLWLKAFLVNAILHSPNMPSRYVYVELTDPSRQIKSRVMVKAEDGAFQGYIDLPEDLAEGYYTLRAYTSYMKNWNEEYWPHVPVYVSSPQSATISIIPQFEYQNKNQISLGLYISSIEDKKSLSPTILSVTYNGKTLSPKKKNDLYYCTFDRTANENILLIECDKYKKYITIPNPSDDYDITFFPEGGNLLLNTANCIAFKSLYGSGKSANISGYIADEKGDSITNLTTYHDGMGLFFIKPEPNVRYHAITRDEKGIEKKIELPPAINGIGLRINTIKNDLHLSISKSPEINTDSLYIIMHTRGIPCYMEKWDNNKNEISFSKSKFLSGILHILLVNSRGQTWSERLIFCNNNDQAILNKKVTSDIKIRDHVSVDLQILDQQENSLEANLLVSITDDKDVDASLKGSIRSSLLLTSDIRGYISNSNYYLEGNNPKVSKALDLLMLTHGWRRYNIPDLIQSKYQRPNIPIEIGQEISGQVLGGILKTKPIKDAQVSIFSKQTSFFDVTTTDNDGRFHFRNFEFPDSTVYFIQAISKKGSSGVELVLEKDTIPAIGKAIYIADGINNKTKTDNANNMDDYAYISKVNKKYTYENGLRLIYLDPIEIKAKKAVAEKSFYDQLSDKTFSREFIEETGANTLFDIVRFMSGFIVENGNLYNTRDGKPVTIFIEGVQIQPFEDQNLDDLVNIQDVEEINVFKSPGKTLILGPSAGSAAIMITMKKGDNMKSNIPINREQIQPIGYQKPAEFYAPQYDTEEKRNSFNPDLRTTIYWNPSLRSKENGKASFDFYTADSPGQYTMIIEGISKTGKIIQSVDKLDVLNSK
ncbi:MAG: hypothetical protein ACK5M3_07520 [Dysgonomonas sp.]